MDPRDASIYSPVTSSPIRVVPPEIVEQRNFAKAAKDRGWRVVWHKTNKPSTANRGTPDFIVAAKGTTWWIEFKRPGEDLAPAQEAFAKELRQNGVQMYVAGSATQAIEIIESNALVF
jgi:hypothetical protein